MSPKPTSRRALIQALERAPDVEQATRIARASRVLADEQTSAEIQDRFNELIKTGRVPVRASRGPVQAAAAVAAVDRGPIARAISYRIAGIVEHLDGRSARARRKLLKAAELLEGEKRYLDAGDIHRALIDVQLFARDYAGARAAVRHAERNYRRSRKVGGRRRGGLAMNKGNLHHRLEEPHQALTAYAEARRQYARAGERVLEANADYNRANVLAMLDRTGQARELYERARKIYVEAKQPALVVQADYGLAAIDLLEGRLDASIDRFEAVRPKHEKMGDRVGVALVEMDEAEALLRLNRSSEAEKAAESAERFFRRTGYDAETAVCVGLLGGAALQQGRARRAATLFRRGRDIEKKRGNSVGAATLEIGLAQAELRAGQPRRATPVAERAARAFRRQRLGSREARALTVGAEAALQSGRRADARRWATRAVTLSRRRNDYRVQLAAQLVLGRIEQESGRPDAAYRRLLAAEKCVDRLRLGVSTEESRLAFAADKSEVYEALVMNRLERGTTEALRQALVFAERGKARALAERLAEGKYEGLGEHSPEAHRLLNRLKRVERELALAESRLESQEGPSGLRGGTLARLESLSETRVKTLRSLTRKDPGLSALAGGVLPDPLQGIANLDPDEVVLEYTAAEGRFHLFIVGRDGIEAVPGLASVDEVRDLADLLRFQLGKAVLGGAHADRYNRFLVPAIRGYLGKLHELLLDPVIDRISGRRVRIVPHGALHGLPFHALEKDGQALIDHALVSYAPSLTVMDLLSQRPRGTGRRPLVLGVPDQAAPLIEAEVATIQRHLPRARVFRGNQATREAVRLSESRPPLLHVACHGFYAEDSTWTGALRLGDAWLSLPEIYTLRGTADLVVLSGCETGRGTVYSGEEWVGLVRGFLQAGARSVVASLWEVQDDSAVDLIGSFYRELATGATVVEALAKAQRRARRDDPLPLRWAPFMVMGDPDLRIVLRRAA